MPRRPLRLVPVLLALGLAAPAGADAAAVGARPSQSAQDVARYWTDARMRDARPRAKAKPGGGPKAPSPSRSYEPPTYPAQHGKVFLTDDGTNYVCSAPR